MIGALWLRVLRGIASLLMVRHIPREDGRPYLTRYRVLGWMPQAPSRLPFAIYLHQFHSHDVDEAPHNHPWPWALSIILAGGYVEEKATHIRRDGELVTAHRPGGINLHVEPCWTWKRTARTLRAPAINLLTAGTFHRISSLRGETWSLFIVGPKGASWGFLDSIRGFIPWRTRLKERGITPEY